MSACRVADASIPGVRHILDELGVCVTLIEGEDAALLIDTGYGLGGLRAFVRGLTDKPLTVLNTHAHWDHALGNRMFPAPRMHPDDLPLYAELSMPGTRERILERAAREGALPEGFDQERFLNAPLPAPVPETGGTIHLGGLDARVIAMPGHTQGSLIVHVPRRGLLVMGDNWNPTVWMFFECSVPVKAYREALRGALGLDFAHVLTPHGERAYPRAVLEAYVAGMTDELLKNAPRDEGTPYSKQIDTRVCEPVPGMPLVFDGKKL